MAINPIIENACVVFITAFITWFFSRKKQKAEVQGSELDNVEKAIKIWRTQAEDLIKRFDELSKKYDDLSNEVERLRKENRSLKSEIKKLTDNQNNH